MIELLLVKDGTYLGRPTAAPGLPDGYYNVMGDKPKPITNLIDRGLYESVSANSVIGPDERTRSYDFFPLLQTGLKVHLFHLRYDDYFLVEGQTDVVERLANWWSGWGKKVIWSKKSHLNNRRKAYARSCNVLGIVDSQTHVGLSVTPEICKDVAKLVEKKLDNIRAKIDAELSTIGGKVTQILPYWQRCIPMCWVLFEINGVEPTSGMGCIVYTNGDFYYGPWCQRAGQDGTLGGGIMIYDRPPSMTLLDWICGPLYEATQRDKKDGYYFSGTKKPPKFQPSGMEVAVYGEARTGLKDDNFADLVQQLKQHRPEIDLDILSKALTGAERLPEQEGDFPILEKWRTYNCLLTASGRGWRLQRQKDWYDREVDDYRYGFSEPVDIDPFSNELDLGDGKYCNCGYCTRGRNKINNIARDFLARLGLKEETWKTKTQKILDETQPIPF